MDLFCFVSRLANCLCFSWVETRFWPSLHSSARIDTDTPSPCQRTQPQASVVITQRHNANVHVAVQVTHAQLKTAHPCICFSWLSTWDGPGVGQALEYQKNQQPEFYACRVLDLPCMGGDFLLVLQLESRMILHPVDRHDVNCCSASQKLCPTPSWHHFVEEIVGFD